MSVKNPQREGVMVKQLRLLFAILFCLTFAGCLDFGEDIQTTKPTAAQVERCRAEMYLKPSLKLTPLGFKLRGSGIDDTIRFKFETDAATIADIFDPKIVDVTRFKNSAKFFFNIENLSWWDVEGKMLLSGQVELPNVKYMNVGIEKTQDGFVVYIMWHEV